MGFMLANIKEGIYNNKNTLSTDICHYGLPHLLNPFPNNKFRSIPN